MVKLSQFRDTLNIRDLGGFTTQDGRITKSGLLYRTGGLYLLNEEERRAFSQLGVRTIMDLRTTGEIIEHPDPYFEGTKRMQYSGLEFKGGEEIDFSPTGMHRLGEAALDQFEKLKAYYLLMPFDNEAFQIIFAILESREVPLAFHCASGKDRTGVAAMLILLALGVDEKTVLADYLRSNDYLKSNIDQALIEHAASFKEHPLAEKLTRMEAGVIEEIGTCVLDAIHEKYSTFDAYFEHEFGLTPARLGALKDFYTEAA